SLQAAGAGQRAPAVPSAHRCRVASVLRGAWISDRRAADGKGAVRQRDVPAQRRTGRVCVTAPTFTTCVSGRVSLPNSAPTQTPHDLIGCGPGLFGPGFPATGW